METKNERNSNIELLRILMMFFIILHHLIYHSYIWTINTENQLIARILYSFAKVGVNCFLMISGFFAYKSKVSYKKLCKIIIIEIFYTILFWIIFEENKSLTNLKQSIDNYWFIKGYIIVTIISPLLKKYCDKIPKALQIAIFVISFLVIDYYKKAGNIYILWFILMYLFGIYIYKYIEKIFKGEQILKIFLTIITHVLIIILRTETELIGIIPLIEAALILMIFNDIKIKTNSKINEISKHTIAVFIIHENTYLRKKIIEGSYIKKIYFSKMFLPYSIVVTILIFEICILIDIFFGKIYELFQEKILKRRGNAI